MSEELPSITIRLVDPVKFLVEVDLNGTPQVIRAMLNEATETVRAMIQDQEAANFSAKMSRAAAAFRATQKHPMPL